MKVCKLSRWVSVQAVRYVCVKNLRSLQEVTLLLFITELPMHCFGASPVGHCQNQDGSLV